MKGSLDCQCTIHEQKADEALLQAELCPVVPVFPLNIACHHHVHQRHLDEVSQFSCKSTTEAVECQQISTQWTSVSNGLVIHIDQSANSRNEHGVCLVLL
jgi:hypothetical protein